MKKLYNKIKTKIKDLATKIKKWYVKNEEFADTIIVALAVIAIVGLVVLSFQPMTAEQFIQEYNITDQEWIEKYLVNKGK